MSKKPEGLVADRPVLSLRPHSNLKQKLDEAAETNGRSLAKEAEFRLEASFDVSSASKLERFVQNRPGLSYMIGSAAPLELTNQLGDVLLGVVRHAEERGWSEVEAREALASAVRTVSFYVFWNGDNESEAVPDVVGDIDPSAKLRDLPPALAGFHLAREHLLFNSSLTEGSLVDDTFSGVISNAWTGDRKTVERVEPVSQKPAQKRRRASGKAAGELLGEKQTALLHAQGKLRVSEPFWYQVLSARRS